MHIHESSEDYLEAILRLRETKGLVKKLRENEFIHMDEDNLITLTEKGEEIAMRIYDRHKTISTFLMMLGVPEAVAREDACKIEHDLSEESFNALRRHLLKLQ